MTSTQQWFNFKFFESKSIKTSELEKAQITAACFSRNYLILCDFEGYVRVFDRSMRTQQAEFRAYDGCVTHVKSVGPRIVTLGDDDSSDAANGVGIVKVWDLQDMDEAKDKRPHNYQYPLFSAKYPAPTNRAVLRTNFNDEVRRSLRFVGRDGGAKKSATSLTSPIISFDVSEDLTTIAAGLTNGEIVIVRSSIDFAHPNGRIVTSRLPQPQPQKSSAKDEDITRPGSLHFVGFAGPRSGGKDLSLLEGNHYSHLLFAAYEGFATQWRRNTKGDYVNYVFPMLIGSTSTECTAVNEDGELAVLDRNTKGRVFFFGNEDVLKLCEVDPGTVKMIFHKQYLVTLSQSDGNRKEKFQLSAYDSTAQIRALSESVTNPAWVLPDVGQLLLIYQKEEKSSEVLVNQRAVRYTELEFPVKLKQLFERECYDIAVRMAKKVDEISGTNNEQMNIQKRYGEHLFKKGKYEESIGQYIKTIGGSVEPSYVIRQFLDAQRIKYLTKYLEELHSEKHKIANKNHTTLLLNCFTKMNERDKLKAFINRTDIRFDAHNAIKVCRQAGYYTEATQLAEKYALHNEYVKIQLDNLHDPNKALRFIQSLPVDVAEGIFLDHGKQLIALEPEASTDLLTKLCTKWVSGSRRLANDASSKVNRGAGAAASASGQAKPSDRSYAYEYVHVFVDAPYYMLRFLESVANYYKTENGVATYKILDEDFRVPTSELAIKQRVVYHTLIELYLTKDLKRSIKPADGRTGADDHVDPNANPSALANSSVKTPQSTTSYQAQLDLAYSILENYNGRYDPYHVLALVQQHDFERGILFMLNVLQLGEEIVAHYAKLFERRDLSVEQRTAAKLKLIETCRGSSAQAGTPNTTAKSATETERSMWVSLLSILVRSDLDVSDDIAVVLQNIQEKDLLPPVAVVEILSTNPNLQLRTVRQYVLNMLAADDVAIQANQSVLKKNTELIAKSQSSLRQLTTSATVFQTTKCNACPAPLDLPVVHFLCKHSYHKRCLNDALQCNLCSAETTKMVQNQKDEEAAVDKHKDFFDAVAEAKAEDGFSVVAEHFGHGIFSAPALRKEAYLVGTGAEAFDADAAVNFENEDDFLALPLSAASLLWACAA